MWTMHQACFYPLTYLTILLWKQGGHYTAAVYFQLQQRLVRMTWERDRNFKIPETNLAFSKY